MPGKRVLLSALAQLDARQATAWYRQQGGTALALRWAGAAKDAIDHIGAYPKSGATRYAIELKLDGLRTRQVHGFPDLVFYAEHEAHVDIWRVLHSERDIPAWMGGTA